MDQLPLPKYPKAGEAFSPSASVQKILIDVANRFIAESIHRPSGGAIDPKNFPSVVVKITNGTGADRALGDVLKITDATCAFPNDLPQANREPVFIGGIPAATTDVVAILLEPMPHVTSGDTRVGRAAIMGVITTRINMTDAAHKFATPTENDSTKLTSAASGPIAILDVESGTGTKAASVLLQSWGGGGESGAWIRIVEANPSGAGSTWKAYLRVGSDGNYSDGDEIRVKLITQPYTTIFREDNIYWATLNGTVGDYQLWHADGHGFIEHEFCIDEETGETRCDTWYGLGLHKEEDTGCTGVG